MKRRILGEGTTRMRAMIVGCLKDTQENAKDTCFPDPWRWTVLLMEKNRQKTEKHEIRWRYGAGRALRWHSSEGKFRDPKKHKQELKQRRALTVYFFG
jgi:hypothetical protein